MGWIEDLRTSLGDVFMTLPIILAGILFLLGTFTSNIGMLYLFVGHLILVPTVLYLCNVKGPIAFIKDRTFSPIEFAKWILSLGIFTTFTATTYSGEEDNTAILSTSSVIPLLGFLNPLKFVLERFGYVGAPPPKGANCGVLPATDDEQSFYNEPSSWVGHVVFFFSFVATNAYFIYNQPAPELKTGSNPSLNKDRQEKLDQRVGNRKTIALTAMIASILAVCLLLFFRFRFSPCEAGFFIALFPMIMIAWMGFSAFYFIYKKCGVRPTDILGVVQGMIDPELVDNPIVCVGNV